MSSIFSIRKAIALVVSALLPALVIAEPVDKNKDENAKKVKPDTYETKVERLVDVYANLHSTALVNDLGDAAQTKLLKSRHQEFARVVAAAKVGGISPEEWRKIKASYDKGIQAEDRVRFNDTNLLNRVASQRRQMEVALAAGQITEDEKASLEIKIQDVLNKIKASDGDLEKMRALNQQIHQNSKALTVLRTDKNGKKLILADRKKDDIDEKQKKLMIQFGQCLGSGGIQSIESNAIESQLEAIRKKEFQYAADRVFAKDEISDLNQLLAQTELNIKGSCDKKTISVKDADPSTIKKRIEFSAAKGKVLRSPTPEFGNVITAE